MVLRGFRVPYSCEDNQLVAIPVSAKGLIDSRIRVGRVVDKQFHPARTRPPAAVRRSSNAASSTRWQRPNTSRQMTDL